MVISMITLGISIFILLTAVLAARRIYCVMYDGRRKLGQSSSCRAGSGFLM